MLSGYRVFSRRFVKSFPAVSREFEIETELTVHSLALRIPSTSVPVDFKDRAEGSESKLRTYRDGWQILNVILNLARHERPIYFFGLFAVLAATLAVVLGAPVVGRLRRDEHGPAVPVPVRRVVPARDELPGMIAGLILDGIRKSRHEHSRLCLHAPPGGPRVTAVTPSRPPRREIQSMRRVGVQARRQLTSCFTPG